jgi:hypothetical protein
LTTKKPLRRSRRVPKRSENHLNNRNAVPPYDAAAVGRIAARIEIRRVDLIGSHFDRADAGPIPTEAVGDASPEIGINFDWKFSKDHTMLGCVLTFGTILEGDRPYRLLARFRLVYSVKGELRPASSDIEQFVKWNAVFHAWPYWREYLSSVINRAHLPQFIAPVLPVPMPERPKE